MPSVDPDNELKQTDTELIQAQFTDEDGNPIDVSGYTELKFYLQNPNGDLVVNADASFDDIDGTGDGTDGKVKYLLTKDDTTYDGINRAEFFYESGDSSTRKTTPAGDDWIYVLIGESLATVAAATLGASTLNGDIDANGFDLTGAGTFEADVGKFGILEDRSSGNQVDIDSVISGFPSVSDDGSQVVGAASDLNAGTDFEAVDDGDGTITFNVTGGGGGTSLDFTDGSTTITPSELLFTATGAASASLADDGDGTGTLTIGATDTDTHIDVEDGGSALASDVGTVNLGSNLSGSVSGSTVTVSAATSGGSGASALNDRLSGYLVVASDSMSNYQTVDPASYASPLTEAFNRTSSGEAVYIGLPMGNFNDTGLSTDTTSAYSGVVEGFGMGKATHFSSKITFTGTSPGIRPDGFQADELTFRGFTMDGNGADHPAIEFDSVNDATNPRGTNFENLWIQNFQPSGGEGLIDFKGAHGFSNVFENIHTGNHSGPMFRFNGDDPFMTEMRNIYPDGNNSGTRYPVIEVNSRSPVMRITNLNIGGGYDQILSGAHFAPGDIRLMMCNYEPRSLTSAGDLIDLTAGGSLTTGTLNVTGASGLTDVSSAIKCDASVGTRVIGPIKNIGFSDSDYTNGKLYVTGDPGQAIEFSGVPGEVNNTAGAGDIVNCKLATTKANA